MSDFVRALLGMFLLVALAAPAAAQVRGQPPTGRPTDRPAPTEQRVEEPDTFGVFTFTVENPNEERPYADTLLDGFQNYDPTRRVDFDYGNLGILGSAHQPLRYAGRLRRGMDLGWRQFDLYQITGRSLTYYRLQRPFTYLQYVQGSEQADGYIQAKFSRNFADGLNFVLDYTRIAQLGQLDQYPAQNLRNTAVATGMWLNSPGGRYNGFLSFAANTVERQENGGLAELPDLTGEFQTPSSAVPYLVDTRRRHANREWMLTQYLRFGGRADSLGNYRRAFTLSHQFTLSQNTYRLSGPGTEGDTAFYNTFPFLVTDLRGFRNYTEHNFVENTFRVSTYRLSRAARADVARSQRDLVEVGLSHRFNKVRQEPADSTINNLLLHGQLGFQPSERLRLVARGQLALLDQVGDYWAGGELFFDVGTVGQLRVEAYNQLYTPALFQERYNLTQQTAWNENFRRTLETNLVGSYTLPGLRLQLGGGYHLINNYIYFDTTGLPRQTSSAVNVLQLWLEKSFRLGPVNLRNRLLVQSADAEVLRLPSLLGEHSLYYDGRWFRVLLVNFGVDVRYTNSYRANYYNPITGWFQLQDRQETSFVPAIDAFFSLRVTRFRAFFKMENLNTALFDDLFYLTARYPYPDAAFRLGIGWRLLD